MNNSQAVLLHDLTILEAMLNDLPDYLMSNATKWPLHAQFPALTIGGCLMRLNRLGKLKEQLPILDRDRYRQATVNYEEALKEKVVRFEQRAHQELHIRLGEWAACLRNLQHDNAWYCNKADTRVVVEEMIQVLAKRPYQLQPQIQTELQALDNNLKNRWSPGDFVWDPVWLPAYNQETYWWLYGAPVAIAVP